jgi:hypothetical protein
MNSEEKADDALFSGLAAEEEHLALRSRHLIAKERKQLPPQIRRFVHQRKESKAPSAPNLDAGNGLCGEEIAVLEGHAENIASIDKTHNRPSTIWQDFVDPQYALQDIEDLAGPIALPEHRFAGGKRFGWLPTEKVPQGWSWIGRTD